MEKNRHCAFYCHCANVDRRRKGEVVWGDKEEKESPSSWCICCNDVIVGLYRPSLDEATRGKLPTDEIKGLNWSARWFVKQNCLQSLRCKLLGRDGSLFGRWLDESSVYHMKLQERSKEEAQHDKLHSEEIWKLLFMSVNDSCHLCKRSF